MARVMGLGAGSCFDTGPPSPDSPLQIADLLLSNAGAQVLGPNITIFGGMRQSFFGRFFAPSCPSCPRAGGFDIALRFGVQRMRHSQTSQRGAECPCVSPAWTWDQRQGHEDLGTTFPPPTPNSQGQGGTSWQGRETPTTPCSPPPPAPAPGPAMAPTWHPTPCGTHHHKALPRNEPSSGPSRSAQTTEHMVPQGPLPSWRLSKQASECQAPMEGGCWDEGRERKGEAGTEASNVLPPPPVHPQNPLVRFPSSFLCFPLQPRRRPPKLPASPSCPWTAEGGPETGPLTCKTPQALVWPACVSLCPRDCLIPWSWPRTRARSAVTARPSARSSWKSWRESSRKPTTLMCMPGSSWLCERTSPRPGYR